MEINTKIDKKNNLRIHTVKGCVSKEKLFSILPEIYASPDFNPDMNALWDVRCADLRSVVMSDVVETCAFVQAQWEDGRPIRVAFLVGSEVDHTLATMYETLSTGSAKLKNSKYSVILKNPLTGSQSRSAYLN